MGSDQKLSLLGEASSYRMDCDIPCVLYALQTMIERVDLPGRTLDMVERMVLQRRAFLALIDAEKDAIIKQQDKEIDDDHAAVGQNRTQRHRG